MDEMVDKWDVRPNDYCSDHDDNSDIDDFLAEVKEEDLLKMSEPGQPPIKKVKKMPIGAKIKALKKGVTSASKKDFLE